ncbi:phage tail protein [Cupriavidus basilensis]|uniref:phage tail protein n=1 Tax=Cupriavidus basilensis TaxID=68895 RepID=UPI0020A6D0D2|nr:phage tail protein [Cupriavidus basilensis]MCP3022312.1 tail fiber protein [Cupriavidus basilensis]
MSQHDLVIDNQAGGPFRADLNNALQAQASNQSGSAEPSPTYPCQFWADIGNGLFKMRNAANTAWIKLGPLGVTNFGLILPGTVLFHAKGTAPPAGCLKANGAAVSRNAYADLFAEIGTAFGAGDGSTTFNLPELRGEFPRGWDDGRGVDAGRVFGSAQAQGERDHYHPISGTRYDLGAGGYGLTIAGSSTGIAALSGTGETRPRNVALLACIKF